VGACIERRLRARLSQDRGRPALDLDSALAGVETQTGVDFRPARARAGFSRGHLLDVVLKLPGAKGTAEELAGAEALLAGLLGDATVEDWLGELSVLPAPRGGALAVLQSSPEDSHFFPLSELQAAIGAAVRGLYAGLPDAPLWASGGEHRWTLLELDVERADDYPAQADVALCSTFMPEMLKCYLAGSPFASRRFSRHGEIFAYLKSERPEGDPKTALAVRRVLEDALDAALVTERAGRVVGSGMGIVYSYVDFALASVDRALDVVRTVAARVGLPQRSWVLFCDSALEGEWAAIFPGTPAPPL
jgi:hypothetical protein